jgi:hypothetical protein
MYGVAFSDERGIPVHLCMGLANPRLFFFFLTRMTGLRRYLGLELSDTRVCEPQMRARLGSSTQPATPSYPLTGVPRS